jgi:hypothetical protein
MSPRQASHYLGRHDYARVWRTLNPSERDRRITHALNRLSEGATLEQIAAEWRINKSALCRALIAYAPLEWRIAKVARAWVRYEQIIEDGLKDPGNPVTRAKAWYARWHLEYSFRFLEKVRLALRGRELVGRCPDCKQPRSVVVFPKKKARCFHCGWDGELAEVLKKAARAAYRRPRTRITAHV